MLEQLDKIWVELDVTDGVQNVNHYCGLISIMDYEGVLDGSYEKPFIKAENVFWYNWPQKDAEEWHGKQLVEYGKGYYTEYQGEIIVRVENIVMIQRLNHGPKDLRV